MKDEEYCDALEQLKCEWAAVYIDPQNPGILRATNDPTTGILVGRRAALIAEIINRALSA